MKYRIKNSLANSIAKVMATDEPPKSKLKEMTMLNHINIGKIIAISNKEYLNP
jgi:hypothetical protein